LADDDLEAFFVADDRALARYRWSGSNRICCSRRCTASCRNPCA